MSAVSDDDDELEMLREAALKSKRSVPDDYVDSSQKSDVSAIQCIEAVERVSFSHSSIAQNMKHMGKMQYGHSRYQNNRTGFSREPRSNLIVIQTVPLDGDSPQASQPINLNKPKQHLQQQTSSATPLLLRPQDKWNQKDSSLTTKTKVRATKFSRYNNNSDSSSDSDSDENADDESNTNSDADNLDTSTVPTSVVETESPVISSTVIFDCIEDVTLPTNDLADFDVIEKASGESPPASMPVELTINESVIEDSSQAQLDCAVPVVIENPVIDSSCSIPIINCRRSPSAQSDLTSESSLSRSPTPIRSPLRLISQPVTVNRSRSPLRRDAHRFGLKSSRFSPSKIVDRSSSPSRAVNSAYSYQRLVSPYNRRSPSPYQRIRSPVGQFSRLSSNTNFRSRSRSPARNAVRLSPKDIRRSKSKSPNYTERSSAKDQLKLPSREYKNRSQSPSFRRRSRSPVAVQSMYLISKDREVKSRSPYLSQSRFSPKLINRSRSRSPVDKVRNQSPPRYKPRSPETSRRSRSPGNQAVSSRNYQSVDRREKRQLSVEKFRSKSSEKKGVLCSKRKSRSSSRSHSIERFPRCLDQSRSANDRNIHKRLGMSNVQEKRQRSRSTDRRSRSVSVDRKASPRRGECLKSENGFRSRSTEREKVSDLASRSSRSPMHKRNKVVGKNSRLTEKSVSCALSRRNSGSSSRSNSIERIPRCYDQSRSRNGRNIRDSLGVNNLQEKRKRSRSADRRSRSLSVDRKALPQKDERLKPQNRFRSRSTERSERVRYSASRISRSPEQGRKKSIEKNGPLTETSVSSTISHRNSPLRVGSGSPSPRVKYGNTNCRSTDLSPYTSPKHIGSKSKMSSSTEKVANLMDNKLPAKATLSEKSNLWHRSTSLEKRAYSRIGEKQYEGSAAESRKPRTDKNGRRKTLAASRDSPSAISKLTSMKPSKQSASQHETLLIGAVEQLQDSVQPDLECSNQYRKLAKLDKAYKSNTIHCKLAPEILAIRDKSSRVATKNLVQDSYSVQDLESKTQKEVAMLEKTEKTCGRLFEAKAPALLADDNYDEFEQQLCSKKMSKAVDNSAGEISSVACDFECDSKSLSNSSHDYEDTLPMLKHISDLPRALKSCAIDAQNRKPKQRERLIQNRKTFLETDVSNCLTKVSDESPEEESAVLKSVLSVVKVPAVGRRHADVTSEPNTSNKLKIAATIDNANRFCRESEKSSVDAQDSVDNRTGRRKNSNPEYQLSEKLVKSGDASKPRASVHSRLGAPPSAASDTETLMVDKRMARFGGASEGIPIDDQVQLNDLRSRIRRQDKGIAVVERPDDSVGGRHQSRKNTNRNQRRNLSKDITNS